MPANRKEARRKAGFRTQADFAKAIGWHKSSVANVECGQREAPEWYDWLLELVTENNGLKEAQEKERQSDAD